MIIYFIALFISLIGATYASKALNRRTRIFWFIISMLPFILLAGLRSYNVGIDTWRNYGAAYTSVAQYGDRFNTIEFLHAKYEIGFSGLILVLSKICTDPVILFITCSTIIISFTYVAILQQSKKINYSILLFFLSGAFLLSMNGMRSYVAIAIILYSLKYIPQRKPLHFLLLVVIAALIHRSTLIFALLYPLYSAKIKPKYLLYIMLSCIILLPIIPLAAKLLLSSTPYINYFTTTSNMVNPLWSMLIINILLLIFFMFNYKKQPDDQLCSFYLKIQILSVIICICSFVLPQSYRIEQLIDYIQIISIPYNLYLLRNVIKLKKSLYLATSAIIIALYGAYFTKVFILHDDNIVRNYSSIIENWIKQ